MENNYTQNSLTGEIVISPERLSSLIEEKKYQQLKEILTLLPPPDLAELFEELDEKNHILLFRLLHKEQAAEVFVWLDSDLQENLIGLFSDKELSSVLNELYIDDTVELIEEMPAMGGKRIIKQSSKENREDINRILRYPKDSAGSLMTTEYVRLNKNMTVEQALVHIRSVAIDKETIYTCYVTEKDKKLIGIVTAKRLLLAEPDTLLSEIMDTNVIKLHTHEDREEAAAKFDKYGFDLDDTTVCQVYKGLSSENPQTTLAVEQTKGIALYSDGKLASLFYSSSSGGYVEDVKNVWGSSGYPYLINVYDPYDALTKWEVKYTVDELKKKLSSQGVDVGDITDISVAQRTDGGRALQLIITGTQGTHTVTRKCHTDK